MKSGSLLHLALRSLQRHRLANGITILTTALAVGLAFAVFAINAQAQAAFVGGGNGYDAVLGARGSQLQLVLNSIFHLETSPGNIPWTLYEAAAERAGVKRAVPVAVGDNYRGFRLVGTTLEYFTDPPEDAPPWKLAAGGRFFDSERREAVVGSFAARQTGLQPGSTFSPYHGLVFDEDHQHHEEYLVVGILEPTNTPVDRVIFIPIEGIFRMEGHILRGSGETFVPESGHPIPTEHREVSAVLLDLANPQIGFSLEQQINRQGKVATLAFPIGRVVAEVFQKMGWAHRVLALVSYLVLVIAGASILANLVQTLSSRKKEFAVLRALGMPRKNLFGLLVLESSLLALLGSLGGFLVYALVLLAASSIIRAQTGVVLQVWSFHPVFLWGPAAMVGLGALAGTLPAWKAYRTEVAGHLRG
ncbi:MAG: ABC transporter permease [Vulcanimicrobiota bacterium]